MSLLEPENSDDDWDDLTPSLQDRLLENLQQLETEHVQKNKIDSKLWTEDLTVDPLENNDESSDIFEDFLDQLLQMPFKSKPTTAAASSIVETRQCPPLVDCTNLQSATIVPKDNTDFDKKAEDMSTLKNTQHQQSAKEFKPQNTSNSRADDENQETPFSIETNTVKSPQPRAPMMLMGFKTASGKSILKEAQQKALEEYKESEKLKATKTQTDLTEHSEEQVKSEANNTLKRTASFTSNSAGDSQSSATAARSNKRPAIESLEDTYSTTESILEKYGGFKTGNSKRDWKVTAAAKRRAISLLTAETSTSEEHIGKTKDNTETLHNTAAPVSPNFRTASAASIKANEASSFKSPTISSKPTAQANKLLSAPPVRSFSKIPKQKAFKSPVVAKERTKAALRGKTTHRIKGAKVFDLTIPSNRYTIRSFGNPLSYTREQLLAKNVSTAIIDMTLQAAKRYRFDGNWGYKEAAADMEKAGILSDRISSMWIENHFGMIVWKNACLIRSYPDKLLGRWTSQYVLEQLLYRYEREINMGQRSVMKRIFEQDDTPERHMVLCVTDIFKKSGNTPFMSSSRKSDSMSSEYLLKVSDGWYEVPACCDKRMERAIMKGKLKIGHKLSLQGAQIVGVKKAQSPLDVQNNETLLMVAANSCLPARFDAKLGYQRQKPSARSISSIFEDGGLVATLDVIICRKFPLLYTEWLPNDVAITRTAKEEEDIQNEINKCHFYRNNSSVAFPYFSAGKRRGVSPHLDRSKSEPQPLENRRVTGSFRVRICDSKSSPGQQLATLSIYGANELQHLDIMEGSRYKIYFVQPTTKNKKYSGLELKTLPITRWEPVPINNQPSAYVPRCLTLCSDIQKQGLYSSMDVVGYVLHASPAELQTIHGRRLWHQKAFVTDESQSICHVSLYIPEKSYSDINGHIIALINIRFEAYDSKFGISNLRTTDDTEVLTKLTFASDYIKKGYANLKNWKDSKPDEFEAVISQLNDLI